MSHFNNCRRRLWVGILLLAGSVPAVTRGDDWALTPDSEPIFKPSPVKRAEPAPKAKPAPDTIMEPAAFFGKSEQTWDLWNQHHPDAPPPCCEVKECGRVGWLDNLSLFAGLDGSKAPEDLGINANFGVRGAVNWSYPVLEKYGVGVQIGSAFNYSENAVPLLKSVDGTHERNQSFTTAGLFQRTEFGLNWGVVYDFLYEDYYQRLEFGQVRGQIGFACGNEEVGLWGARRSFGDSAAVAGQRFELRPILQGNLFWKHIWRDEITTRVWVGAAEEHGRFVLVAPGNAPVHHPLVFGADLYVPLGDYIALFGEANFITPYDTGTVTATLGFAFYPGGKARGVARSRFAPLLAPANNESFAIDLRQ